MPSTRSGGRGLGGTTTPSRDGAAAGSRDRRRRGSPHSEEKQKGPTRDELRELERDYPRLPSVASDQRGWEVKIQRLADFLGLSTELIFSYPVEWELGIHFAREGSDYVSPDEAEDARIETTEEYKLTEWESRWVNSTKVADTKHVYLTDRRRPFREGRRSKRRESSLWKRLQLPFKTLPMRTSF